jgi:outer membrane lipoprotein LolB
MRHAGWLVLSVCLIAGCATTRAPFAPSPWEQRLQFLQAAHDWRLDGRAAVAFGAGGWQASLTWTQAGDASEVHLAGPLGIGAQVLRLTPAGLTVNGAPADGDVLARLEERVGFELPLAELRYWLLGVPDPGTPGDLTRNALDRAGQLRQDGWVIDYDRYGRSGGDWLPLHLAMTREAVRVRIVIDQWSFGP